MSVFSDFMLLIRVALYLILPVGQFSRCPALFRAFHRSYATEAEARLKSLLQTRYPKAENIEVTDVSGGCGAMFQIFIKSKDFSGMSVLEQHRSVKETLKEEIKEMHGLTIVTEE